MRDVDNFHCGDCKYFRVDADWNESACKRIDHKHIKFYRPFFKSYDCNQNSSVVCSDFIPANQRVNAVKEWRGFEEYWRNYVEQWLPYSDTNVTRSFFLNGNTDESYQVKLLDFVYGNMFEGNKLKAVSKQYYKQCRNPNGCGYKLITEPIDGVVCDWIYAT